MQIFLRTFIISFLVSCNSHSKSEKCHSEKENVVAQSEMLLAQTEEKGNKNSQPVKKHTSQTLENFQITENRVGMITKGMTISDVYNNIPKGQIKKKKGVGEFAEDIFDVFEVYDTNGKILLVLTPERYGDDNSKIRVVTIMDKRFETAQGIGLKSTFGDLEEAYVIDELAPDLEHIVVLVNSINTSFAISKTELQEGWFTSENEIDTSKIPATAQFDSVSIIW